MRFFRLCILLATSLSSGGCAVTRPCGDARVAHQGEADFPWEIGRQAGETVTLPPVSLARAGTTEFTVSSLPPGTYKYALELAGGPLYHGANLRGAPSTRGPRLTNIAVSITDPNGRLLFQKEHALGEIKVGRSAPVMISDGFFPPFYKNDGPLAHALSYRVRITIRQPSMASHATARIVGFSRDGVSSRRAG